MNEQLGMGGLDLEEFYGEPWGRLVDAEKARGLEVAPGGPRYSPEQVATLMAGAILHPLDAGQLHLMSLAENARPPIAA